MSGMKRFFQKKHPILIRVLSILTLFATAYTLILPATALARPQYYCGMEEHVHSDTCEENCTRIEHEHTRQCEANLEADVEDESVWTAAFADVMAEPSSSGKSAAIALSQVGSHVSSSNFQVLEDGSEAPYSRYGAWEGNPYTTNLQESFLRFVYSYAGADMSSFASQSVKDWMDPLLEGGLLRSADQASEGDLAFVEDEGKLKGAVVIKGNEEALDVVEADEGEIVSKSVANEHVYGTVRVLLDADPAEAASTDASTEESAASKKAENANPAAANQVLSYTPAQISPQADETAESCPAAKFPESNPEGNLGDEGYNEHPTAAKIYYRYPQNSGNTPTEWTEIEPDDDNTENDITYKMNVEFKMVVNYENLKYTTIEDNNHSFYYSIPAFLHSNMAAEGTPLMHTFEREDGSTKTIELGRLHACPTEDHLHIDYSNYLELEENDIKTGQFEYSLLANREEIWENPNQEYQIGDKNYTFKFDTSSSYNDVTVHDFKKAKNPEGGNHENYSYDEEGNTIIHYQISFVTDDQIAPDAIVDDWWPNYSSWSQGFKEGFTPYENIQFFSVARDGTATEIPQDQYSCVLSRNGSSDPLELTYHPVTNPKETVTHTVEGAPAPRAGFYLGTLQPNTQYRLTYNAKYSKNALNHGVQDIRNDSRIRFGTSDGRGYDWEDDRLQSTLTVGKSNLGQETRTDDDGNLYLTYKLSVIAGEHNMDDWPVGVVTDYMNFQVDHVAQPGYLSYVSMVDCQSSSDDQNYTSIPINEVTFTDQDNGTIREYRIPAPETMSRGQRYYIKCQIRIDRELMVKMATENKEQMTYANLAYTGDTYSSSGPHSGTVSQNIQKSEIVTKAKGEMLTENTPMTMTGDVYDAAGQKTDVTEFTVPIHSVQYSIKINEDGKANVGSAALTDELSVSGTISDQFSFTGYAALKVYDGRQDPGKEAMGTIWFKLPDDQQSFQFDLSKYRASVEDIKQAHTPEHALSYELIYYVCAKDGADNLMLTNELNGSVGVGIGDSVVPVEQHIHVSHLIVTSEELSAVKRGVSYLSTQEDHEANGTWKAGRQIWLVEVSGSTISKESTLSDTLTNQTNLEGKYFTHYVPGESVIGLYRGTLEFAFDGTQNIEGDVSHTSTSYPAGSLPSYTYQDFLTAFNSQTSRIDEDLYTVTYASDNRTVNIRFKENYSLIDENGDKQKLYILLQSTPDENSFNGGEQDLIWKRNQANISTGNGFSAIQGNETKKLADAQYGFRSYYSIHKSAGSRFAYQNGEFKKLDDSNLNSVLSLFNTNLKPILDEKIADGELSNHEIYDDWTLLVNRQGGDTNSNTPYSGTFKIVDTISDNASFVGAFLANTGENQPTIDSITVEGQKVTIIVSNVSPRQAFTIHLISKLNVDWDEAIASDSRISVVNHVDLYHDQNRIGVDEETKNTKLSNPISKDSATLVDDTTALSGKSTIEYSIDLNENRLDLIESADTIDVQDTYDPDVIEIIPDTIQVTADGAAYTDFTVEFRKEEGTVIIRNLPDQKRIHITYSASLQVPPGENSFSISNSCTWLGYGKDAPSSTFTKWATNTIGGTSSSVNITPKVTLKKVDANNATQGLAGATFSFTAGTVTNGVFKANGNNSYSFTATTDSNGQIIANEAHGNKLEPNIWYKVKETSVPAGYDPNSIEDPQYFYIYKDLQHFPAENERPREGRVNISELSPDKILYLTFTNKKPVFSITIRKSFSEAGLLPGNYTFGVYDREYDPNDASQQPLKKVTITVTPQDASDSTEKTADAVIDNLEIRNDPYYVYELGEDGKPCPKYWTSSANDQLFEVIYPANGNGVTYSNASETDRNVIFEVQNHPIYELPETGGVGTSIFYAGGSALVLSAACLVLLLRRKD